MIITSVVGIIGYYAWFVVNRQFVTFHHRSLEIGKYYRLSAIWQKDFDKATGIEDTPDDRHLVFSRADTIIRYSIDNNLVVRQTGNLTDSFPLPVTNIDIRYVDDSLPLIEAITLTTRVNGDSVLLSGKKRYSSKEIMTAEKQEHE